MEFKAEKRSLVQELNQISLADFRQLFTSLASPARQTIQGVYQAEFVGPSWLRRVAGPGLVPLGLSGWWGKQFDDHGHGFNIVHRQGILITAMPVELIERSSQIDGQKALVVTYPHGSRFPWPWVVDELRALEGAFLLGMTLVIRQPLSKLPLPFLLQHQPQFSLLDSGKR